MPVFVLGTETGGSRRNGDVLRNLCDSLQGVRHGRQKEVTGLIKEFGDEQCRPTVFSVEN